MNLDSFLTIQYHNKYVIWIAIEVENE